MWVLVDDPFGVVDEFFVVEFFEDGLDGARQIFVYCEVLVCLVDVVI